MKTRKIKLISSFVALSMVSAVLGVGVWAAASQSVNVRTSVTFTATAVSGTILGTLTGLDRTTYYYNTTFDADGEPIVFAPRTEPLGDWILGTETPLKIDNTEGKAADILYTFTLKNNSTTDAMNVFISAVSAGTNLQITSIFQDDVEVVEADDYYTLTPIIAENTSVITVLFNVVDEASSITSADISFNLALRNPNAEPFTPPTFEEPNPDEPNLEPTDPEQENPEET